MFGACAFAQAQDRPGWTLNWADEFSAATINTTRWEKLNRRDSYNNEQQYYTPNQLSIVNNALRITATNQPLDGKPYRSGLVRTWAEQTYGRWEIRASLPTTQGMWPAIWLLPRNTEWPDGGEI
ncbi:MAG TPA: glycoside hydrolase family 16 protein, partial [Tepidisphaeraceae bacterium]|nr:glycoside hydrolase family 16 protein [Tepidisphaeraceae bacterium]